MIFCFCNDNFKDNNIIFFINIQFSHFIYFVFILLHYWKIKFNSKKSERERERRRNKKYLNIDFEFWKKIKKNKKNKIVKYITYIVLFTKTFIERFFIFLFFIY